ncbi:thioredoxin domain-containing protein 9-like [Artemia franciscana]|uniref:Phosducin domain-containing protein n=1 Tax=Artemia franciscana TaxID=6661 RepID=A0AA88KWA7_ARTSF|nr:hypothetical protein QYM36_016324 [Artemia franciscana]
MEELSSKLQKSLVNTAQAIEEQLDAELKKLDKPTEDDLEEIRKRRIEAMKHRQKQLMEWRQLGHGEYEELKDEKEFFDVSKKSQLVVCHFYRDSTPRCQIVDKHLNMLAKKHLETKFCKINAEKSPFLADRLRIKIIPTMALVKSSKIIDYIIGFTDLGGIDDFSTELLEWRLAKGHVIEYSGDLTHPPEVKKKVLTKKSIRDSQLSDDSDDD